MASQAPNKLSIELVEDPDAPKHRRWRGRIELPDGRAGDVYMPDWNDLWHFSEFGHFVCTTCARPGCEEPCSGLELCPVCDGFVCVLCNVWNASAEPHTVEDHYLDDLTASQAIVLRVDGTREIHRFEKDESPPQFLAAAVGGHFERVLALRPKPVFVNDSATHTETASRNQLAFEMFGAIPGISDDYLHGTVVVIERAERPRQAGSWLRLV